MPYIITTTTREAQVLSRYGVERSAPTRRAVATLEEARLTVAEQLGDHALMLSDQPIATVGGTVGPLPDGTVIEVEPMGWQPDGLTDAEAVDAYNAAQGDAR